MDSGGLRVRLRRGNLWSQQRRDPLHYVTGRKGEGKTPEEGADGVGGNINIHFISSYF